MREQIKRVAVIGQGVIGRGWTAFFAGRRLNVSIYDLDRGVARAALSQLPEIVSFLEREGLAEAGATAELAERVTLAASIEEAVREADYVQEAVAEDYGVKRAAFAAADAVASPDVLIASSSSGLLMTEIQKATKHPERCLIAHPINPSYLIPLVELVPGKSTSADALSVAREFLEGLGKIPVTLTREISGYLENRLTAALWREAIDLVHQGVASVEDIDKTIWAGPGLRYALMGPHLIFHLGGGSGGIRHFIDHLGPAFHEWWADMATWTTIPAEVIPSLEQGVRAGMDGHSYEELVEWRDGQLVRLNKLLGANRKLPPVDKGSGSQD